MAESDFESKYFALSRDGDVAVATFSAPRLTEEDNIEQLGHELSNLVDKLQHRRVVLDLGTIEYATSPAIGKLIMLHRKLDREHGRLVLCGLTPGLFDILDTARLTMFFKVTTTPQQAVELCAAST